VNGSLAVGNEVTVKSGGILGGTGLIGGPVNFEAGSFGQFTLGSTLALANSLTVAAVGTLPVVRVNLTNNVPSGTYTLATYNTAGSSGAFDSVPAIVSGSIATGNVTTVTTSGGVVSLAVIEQVPPTN